MDVESRDSVSLKPAELDELGLLVSEIGLPLQDEQLDGHVEQFPLVAIAAIEGEPQGFLFVTAANLVRDHWRKLERERRAVRRATAEAAIAPCAEPADPSVRMLVQSLPDRLRVPILLHYYADMPIREVSALTGRKEGTVKSDLRAARELLRAHLRRGLEHTL